MWCDVSIGLYSVQAAHCALELDWTLKQDPYIKTKVMHPAIGRMKISFPKWEIIFLITKRGNRFPIPLVTRVWFWSRWQECLCSWASACCWTNTKLSGRLSLVIVSTSCFFKHFPWLSFYKMRALLPMFIVFSSLLLFVGWIMELWLE